MDGWMDGVCMFVCEMLPETVDCLHVLLIMMYVIWICSITVALQRRCMSRCDFAAGRSIPCLVRDNELFGKSVRHGVNPCRSTTIPNTSLIDGDHLQTRSLPPPPPGERAVWPYSCYTSYVAPYDWRV
jgi:hypothetical protein